MQRNLQSYSSIKYNNQLKSYVPLLMSVEIPSSDSALKLLLFVSSPIYVFLFTPALAVFGLLLFPSSLLSFASSSSLRSTSNNVPS